jgi:hypothetical protein
MVRAMVAQHLSSLGLRISHPAPLGSPGPADSPVQIAREFACDARP